MDQCHGRRPDEAVFEYARFLADLMAVDGALVLTAARDLIGFGAEIHVPTIEKEVVLPSGRY
jgi:hypothetical protein